MARIVLGLGASHSPLLALEGRRWSERAADDRRNQKLNLSDGRFVSYQQLAARNGEPYAALATEEKFMAMDKAVQASLDRLADTLEAAAPDVVVIIGDDQAELFSPANMPALAIHTGEEIVMKVRPVGPDTPPWRLTVAKGNAMDAPHRFPAHPALARELVEGLIARDFDVGVTGLVEDPQEAGFGHAYGFIIKRLFRERRIPVVPVLLNTYFPPNVPSPRRCHDLGLALRAALEESRQDLRIAVVASGGLSHFVVDEALDRRIVTALREGDAAVLRSLPVPALMAGSSEIRNWITLAGMVQGMRSEWLDYTPIYRTPAGTGIGVAFGAWK